MKNINTINTQGEIAKKFDEKTLKPLNLSNDSFVHNGW